MQQPIARRPGPHPEPQPLHTPTYIERDPSTVVQGNTLPMQGPAVRGLFVFGLLFILAFAGLAAYYASRISADAALIAFLLVFGILAFFVWRLTIIVASGNYAARLEIHQRGRLEARKMQQAELVYERQLQNQAQRDRYLYQLEKERLAKDEELQRLRIELATTRHQERVYRNAADQQSAIDGEARPVASKGYVTHAVSPVRQAVIDYLLGDGENEGVYGYDGQPNPTYVDLATGKLVNHTIPWSTRGPLKGSEARKAAQAILQPATCAPIVVYNPQDKAWYLNLDDYADAETVQTIIGSY